MKRKYVNYLALPLIALGMVSCQTMDQNVSHYRGPGEALGRGIDNAFRGVGMAASSGTYAAAQGVEDVTRNVGWFARNSATGAGDGVATVANGVNQTTRQLGRNIFRPARFYPQENTPPAGLIPVRGQQNPERLSRYDASVQGYRLGFNHGHASLAPEPTAATQAATTINRRAYYHAYMRGWNAAR